MKIMLRCKGRDSSPKNLNYHHLLTKKLMGPIDAQLFWVNCPISDLFM